MRHGVLDECYSGIPRTSVGCLVLGDGSPSIPAFTLYTLRLTHVFPPSVMLLRFLSQNALSPLNGRPLRRSLNCSSATLRPTQAFPPSVMCTVVLAVSPVFPCQSVFIRGRYIFPATCCVFNILAYFLSLPLAIMLSWFPSRVNPCLYTLHFTPYTKNNHQKCIFPWPYDRFCQFGVVPLQKILKIYNYEQQQSNYRLSNCRQSNTN